MQDNDERKIVEGTGDPEIAMAIRYLDPDRCRVTSSVKPESVFVICLFLIATATGILAYMWLYFRAL
jgi:hypothetical protein